MTKKCLICNKVKETTEFYRETKRKGGFAYMCKKCNHAYVAKMRKKIGYYSSEKYRNKFKKDGKTTYENRKTTLVRYTKKNKLAIQAREEVRKALKKGILQKSICTVCGNPKVQAHHHKGYEKENWLEIIWLCNKHHTVQHYAK